MNICPALVANREPPEAVQPGKGSLHHPTMSPRLLAALYASSGYPCLDATLAQELSAARVVVAFVGVELLGALPGASKATSYGPDRVHDLLEELRVVDVGGGDGGGERYTFLVD